jgi:hypothetical protein
MELAAKRIKLPFWRTVADSYRWGLGRLPEVIAKFWLVLLALTVVSFALYWLAQPYETNPETLGSTWLNIFIIPIFTGMFFAMIAVPWHRLVLNGEPLPARPAFDTRIFLYAGWAFALVFPFLASTQLIDMPNPTVAEPTADDVARYITITGSAMVLGTYFLVRFGIKVVAVERNAWRHLAEHVLELLAIVRWNNFDLSTNHHRVVLYFPDTRFRRPVYKVELRRLEHGICTDEFGTGPSAADFPIAGLPASNAPAR